VGDHVPSFVGDCDSSLFAELNTRDHIPHWFEAHIPTDRAVDLSSAQIDEGHDDHDQRFVAYFAVSNRTKIWAAAIPSLGDGLILRAIAEISNAEHCGAPHTHFFVPGSIKYCQLIKTICLKGNLSEQVLLRVMVCAPNIRCFDRQRELIDHIRDEIADV
jgi:hypothetical protein